MGEDRSHDFFSRFQKILGEGDLNQALTYLASGGDFLSDSHRLLAHYAQGVLYFKKGEPKLALIHFNKSDELTVLKNDINYFKAQAHFELNEFERSLSLLDELSSDFKRERTGEVEYLTGLNHLNLKNPQKAVSFLDPLVKKWKRNEKRPYLLDSLLKHALKTSDYSKTIYCRWFKTLYTDHPDFLTSRVWSLEQDSFKVDDYPIACNVDSEEKRSRLFTSFRKGMSEKVEAELNKFSDESESGSELKIDYYYLSGQMKKAIELSKNFYGESLNRDPRLLKRHSRYNYYAGNYEESLLGYKRVVDLYRHPRRRAYQLYYLTRVNVNLNNHDEAESALEMLSRRYRRTPYYHYARWYESWNYYTSERYEEAYNGFKKLLSEFKTNRALSRLIEEDQLMYWMARSLEKSGQLGQAIIVYKKINEDKGLSYYSLLSSLRLQKAFKTQGVELSFEDILNPNWRKRDPVKLAQLDEVFDSVKLSMRQPSALKIGMDEKGQEIKELGSISLPSVMEFEMGKEEKEFQNDLKRFKYLSHLGFNDQASEVLNRLEWRSKTKKFKEKLLYNYKIIHDYRNLSKATLRYFNTERYSDDPFVSNEHWKYAYPKAFEKHVLNYAKKFDVSPGLVWAHMRAESFYNPEAMSPVGAQGLLQIMPYTAEKLLSVELKQNTKEFSKTQAEYKTQSQLLHSLMSPKLNIQMGTVYLSRLKKIFSGHFPLMAAAYNGGPHRVKLWSSQFGNVELDEFVERIPFSETKSYVKKIIFYKYVYSSLYEQGTHKDKFEDLYKLVEPIDFHYKGPHPTKENWDPV